MAQGKRPQKPAQSMQQRLEPRREEPTYAQRTQRESRGRAKRRDNKNKKIIWIVLVILFIAFVLLNYEGGILMKLSDAFQTGISSIGGGDGFPYDINASRIKGMRNYQGNLLMATDNDVLVLSGSAKEVKSTHHGFSTPISVVRGGRVLTYDQGGTKVIVENSSKKIFEKTYDSPVISAAIGEDGSFAVATGSKEASSEVTVYSRNIKEVFKWRSSSGYIMNCALNKNGKLLAVSTVNAKDGLLESTVSVFHLKEEKPLATISYGSSVIAGLDYISGNSLLVTGDDLLSVVTDNKNRTDLLKQDEQKIIAKDRAPDNGLAVVHGKFDNSQTSVLTYVSNNGKVKFTSNIDGVITALSAGNSYVALLEGNTVQVYNKKGECVNSIPLKADALRLQVIGSKIYVQTYTQILVYSATKGVTNA